MKWQQEHGWWEDSVALEPQGEFILRIVGEEGQSIPSAALETVAKLRGRLAEIKKKAADDLLAICNENWAQDGEITAEEFMSKLQPASILIYENGHAEISFEDDDMFWGHYVVVGFREDRFTQAGIEG